MFLEKIKEAGDLRKLGLDKLPNLADEIRSRIIEVGSCQGGHIASSLGAVEIAVALHYCLDTPKDKIIWDVGHQAYAHKIITGRNKNFNTLRQYNGISGFPNYKESIYDTFTTGHSSSAVSLALGLVCARDNLATENYFRVAAVIGDGSLSGGLCFEGLNNAGHLKKDIIVVLNTNELSIAPNAGAISTYINKVISLPIYNRFRDSLEGLVKSRIPKGSRIIKLANKFEEGLKGLFIPGLFFEEMGFRYFGPLNGHDLNVLIPTIKNLLNIKGPRLLHIVTKKGKGCEVTEKEPVKFHSTGPFDIKTGKSTKSADTDARSYTKVFGDKLIELAQDNKKIVAVTAAMPEGTGLDKFRDTYPERFFDVGIAEEHAVCFSGGLAKGGLKPVVAIYSTFIQRAYDQIIIDVALQDLGVVFILDRCGIVGEDGPTHQGIFDMAFMHTVPNMTLMAPKDATELEDMLSFAVGLNCPVAIRYPKGNVPHPQIPSGRQPIKMSSAQLIKDGRDIMIVAVGSMVYPSLEAAEILQKQGLDAAVINARFIKPLDKDLLKSYSSKVKCIFSVEEGIIGGGFGSALADALGLPVTKIGLPCEFIAHGKREILLEKYGLTPALIAKKIQEDFKGHQ